MTTRTARRLAVGIASIYVVTEVAGLAFQFVTNRPEDAVVGLPGKVAGGIIFLGWAIAGVVIVSHEPRNAIGWILLGVALEWALSDLTFGYATYTLITHPGSLPGGAFAALLYSCVFFLAELLIALLFLLFPDGRVLSPRWRVVGWVAAASAFTIFVGTFLAEGRIDLFPIDNPYGIFPQAELLGAVVFLVLFACVVLSVVSLVIRWRRSRGDERQQLKWFAYAAAFLPLSFLFFFFGWNTTTDRIGATLLAIAIIGMPVAAGIAILKYRLYEIDVVISKTVLVGLLAAFATVVYVSVVVVVGALIGSRGGQPSVFLAVVATAIVALAFQPVRARAQRLANRLVYGERSTPYDVLSDLSERLAGAFSADDLLPRMARTLAEGTGAARADVWLREDDRLVTAGSWPLGSPRLAPIGIDGDGAALELDDADLTAPVRHRGELLGAVTVSKKAGEHATPLEERLVRDLASQAGLVLSNVRLIQELRTSRQRLVAARDEERRKLERNLHDGAQQQLVALTVKQRLAEGLIERDPARARGLMEELLSETTDALENLRDLARGIYPPLLADKGLAAALTAQARRATVPVEVRADALPRYATEIEAAVYFCCLEALQNVTKYAHASRATVSVRAEGDALTFVVEDDGAGFEMNGTALGTGLRGMRDRVEALAGTLDVTSRPGSGTRVTGQIPTDGTR